MGVKSWIARWMLSKSHEMAVVKGDLEPMIVIEGREIVPYYADPNNPPDGFVWDPEQYHRGCIFLDRFANPIAVEVSKEEVEGDLSELDIDADDLRLKPSEEYKIQLDTKVNRDLIGDTRDKMLQMIAAGMGITVLLLLGVLGMMQNGAA